MAPVTARSMARRCARRHTRAWYSPLGCAWCHPGAATEALEAVPPLGIAAPAPKRSSTQPIPASRAPPESPMGTRCPPPPPRLQASRSTSSSARGAASRRTSAGAESSATSAQFESTNGKLAFARARMRASHWSIRTELMLHSTRRRRSSSERQPLALSCSWSATPGA